MTDQERKAMEMALDALEFSQKMGRHYEFDEYHHELAPRALYALRQALEQPEMQPCAGRNCGSTNPNLHSAECFEDYEKATGMNQRKPLPP